MASNHDNNNNNNTSMRKALTVHKKDWPGRSKNQVDIADCSS